MSTLQVVSILMVCRLRHVHPFVLPHPIHIAALLLGIYSLVPTASPFPHIHTSA
jgi:hypothetical protein